MQRVSYGEPRIGVQYASCTIERGGGDGEDIREYLTGEVVHAATVVGPFELAVVLQDLDQ